MSGNPLEEELFGDVGAEPNYNYSSGAPSAPPEKGEYRLPFNERPWQEQFADVTGTDPVKGARTFFENAGDIANTADESVANFLSPELDRSVQPSAEMLGPERIQGYDSPLPPAVPPEQQSTYPAGSRTEDMRRTLEQEKLQRDEENPTLATAGKAVSGVAQGALIPGGPVMQTVGGAALTGANMIGAGSGDLSQRADQAVEQAKEHPYMTALAVGAPAVAPGIAKGAGWAKNRLTRNANINTTVAGTTAPQRKAIIDNSKLSRGEDPQAALDALGGDIRARGLHKRPWYEFWKPGFDAETLANNAHKLQLRAEKGLEATESTLAKASPPINYTPISEQLEGAADEVMKLTNKDAAIPEADLMRRQAQYYRNATKVPQHGPAQDFFEDQPFTSKGGGRDITVPSEVQPPFTTKGGPQNFMAESIEPVDPGFTSKGGPRNFVAESQEAVDPGFTSKGGPRNFMAESQEAVEPPFFPSGGGREAPPTVASQDWFDYLNKNDPDLPPPPATIPGGTFEGPDRLPEFQAGPSKTFTAAGPDRPPEFTPGPSKTFTAAGPDRPPEFTPGPQQKFTAEGPERPPEFTGPDETLTLSGPNRPPIQTPGVRPPDIETGEVGWPRAQADLRHGNEQVDNARMGGYKGAPTDEKVQRRINSTLHGQIDEGLEKAVGNKLLQPEDLSDWKGHMKDYSVAATVKDPAMALTQKNYGGSMGMKDLAGTSILSAFGLPGPAAVATTKAMQGSWPGFKANRAAGMANEFGALENVAKDATENAGMIRGAATPHPVAQAQQENPSAPKNVVIDSANNSLKGTLQEAMKQGTDWFSTWFD